MGLKNFLMSFSRRTATQQARRRYGEYGLLGSKPDWGGRAW
ncbi:hypothetical protein UC8_00990 [Roseimaritima ulvae]|uniref:Uncharacterized protein n=1 Tax=Roseimaritima ulvae TaxID=980254 RepID=A0A5B9QM90_9BACT|nr:hypothetical protein UC8_00990 [Roseimaritima ulvae]